MQLTNRTFSTQHRPHSNLQLKLDQTNDEFILIFMPVMILYLHLGAPKQNAVYHLERLCPTYNIITVREGGRLGNSVWEYISVLGLQGPLKLTAFVPNSIIKQLGKVFKNFSIPAYEDILLSESCRIFHGGDVKSCESKILNQNSSTWDHLCHTLKRGNSIARTLALKPITELRELRNSGQLPSILILPKWIANPYAFVQIGIIRFKQEMQFRDDVLKLAQKTVSGVRKTFENSDLIFIGVHVRKTDYSGYLKRRFGDNVTLADLDYYKRAMSRMHDLYRESRLVFVVVSDDYSWCKNNLVNEKEGVFWGGLEHSHFIQDWEGKKNMSVGHDLAVLAIQNHSVIGYGSFALTGSLLSGGQIIACNISRNAPVKDNLTNRLCKLLPNCEML